MNLTNEMQTMQVAGVEVRKTSDGWQYLSEGIQNERTSGATHPAHSGHSATQACSPCSMSCMPPAPTPPNVLTAFARTAVGG